MTIRTRFAPSPTGMLHIGGARTALFSWLYARHLGGEFVLRIEDTDLERSTDEATQVILDGLKWLGLDWDGEPVFQGLRKAEHVVAAEQLIEEGHAYRCYCSREELDAMREEQRANGEKPKYDGRCRHRSDRPEGAPFVVRFRSPDEGETVVRDMVLGDVVFNNAELDDLIILRSDGSPTYNLAVVADDAAMGITHVVRGSDHLNNTPRQIQLYQALGLTPPQFAHIPLIHGPDGAKMSKRHGAVAITEYREAGFLPDAVVNYLARLGWSHGDDEVFSRQQLVELFDLAQVGKTASRFDQQKLDWLNAHYLRESAPAELAVQVAGLMDVDTANGPDLEAVIPTLQERSKNLLELAAGARFFYQRPQAFDEKAVNKNFKPETDALLDAFVQQAAALDDWSAETIHALIAAVCEQFEAGMGKLAQPIRILISGGSVSPPIDATLALLGRAETLERMQQGREKLSAR
ncbi:MAG: glutamate--tRNA ligase [Zetaproteobacteria bacterium CG12_big_fil_rev_8_21_14_0_65_55_1124]|nr:MAG: glutamate--tRNA ligase [Zetaproteobacteria bacterium CG1_02_55_237]PIS20482.1 MAG: glutamate--tRNA ligase [Zetaproteobacteria bacterium CG08_land_8_20_14_0_20_55_17]PIW43761.1 MAG: glutamate--tRNA ligase [Zetaproteobacteria bacterium CG12_big_fil_rev_8_21_14_0_65_55_1124]PIY53296.1 MAG: glutamate--tRNA ligase [Zetaproteobacteria bacterium CG_4_10_14_0_8_um_filter_55_43]PIZ40131.1 MAG: glutamate--tRNA ligase [Zetaproteobacteria bacterium CG_4_10_14_0_2_um_filter_55_20]PJB82136.1 MAG: gl